jgi:steroid delta-isomerase-like uncharacterized protein
VTETEQATDADQLQKNVDTIQRFLDETVNKKNLAANDKLTTADFVERWVPPGFPEGRDATKTFFAMVLSAFPDLTYEVEDVIAQGDRVAVRIVWRGMQTGEFMGYSPSGKRVTLNGIEWMRMGDGRIAEHWGVEDDLGMMQQLGLVSLPGGEGQ